MSANQKQNAYGGTASDTARRTWDRDEYSAKASERDAQRREEGRARYEARLAGRKYHVKALDPAEARATESRAERLNVAANVGKVVLVPAGSAVGKRGRGAGFYCDLCDLTFKDNLQWVEHLNSKQHLINAGESGEVKKATLEEVRERLAMLKAKRDREKAEEGEIDLQDRLKRNVEDDERRREEKRRKRREKRRKTEGGVGVQDQEDVQGGIIH